MVQIIEENKPARFLDNIGRALSGLVNAGGSFMQERKQKEAISQLLGPEYQNLPPEFQQLALQSQLKQQEMGQKLQGESEIEGRDYDIVKNTFGEKVADLWKSQPVGARTEITKKALEGIESQQSLEEKINASKNIGKTEEALNLNKNEIENNKYPDFTKQPPGYTQKQWRDERKMWRQENAPIFAENAKKLHNINKDILSGKALQKLNKSKKLPEGLERLLINPETGDFYGAAEVLGFKSPEAQQWSKIIAQFQNRAKDAFGSRVTNFDLQSYMKQFPGLLNTYEGRKRILEMMDINWELDHLYLKELDDIFKHYGLNGIPQEQAEKLAIERISDKTKELQEKFLKLDFENNEDFEKNFSSAGQKVEVIGPNGEEYEPIDINLVDQLPKGFRII